MDLYKRAFRHAEEADEPLDALLTVPAVPVSPAAHGVCVRLGGGVEGDVLT